MQKINMCKELRIVPPKCLMCVRAQLLWSHLTLCDPMDSSPPGFSVHGIL